MPVRALQPGGREENRDDGGGIYASQSSMMGLFLEEIDEGLTVDLGSYHFTRESIVKFARQYDPQPFHLSEEAGLRGPFGKLSASGWHTASGWMKCFVAMNNAARAKLLAMGKLSPEVGPSPGFTNLS